MGTIEAEQFEENEQYDKAYEEYKKVYEQRPKSLEILERLGHLAMILHKNEEATEYYNKILEIDMTNEFAYEHLMDVYIHSDKYKYYVSRGNLHVIQQQVGHAINDFKKALANAQTEADMNATRFVLANLYEQSGKNNQAIDEYIRILDTQNTNEAVYLKLAKIYLTENAVSSAIEILERARSQGFDTIDVKESLAQLYLKNNQPQKALSLTGDELVKVRSLLDEAKNHAAFEILEKIKKENQKNHEYQALLAQYYYNVKNFDKSLEAVFEYDKLKPNSPLTYQMRALIFEEKGDEFASHLNWAKYSLYRGEIEVALNEYLLAYQINDKNAGLLRNIADLLEDMGDKNQASEFYEKLAEIEPSDKQALQKIAEFRENIGDYRAAAEILEKWYTIDDKNAFLIKKLAKIYEKLKNKEKALEFYQKFITISPVNEEYEETVQKIAKLKSSEMQEDEGLIGKIMNLFAKR